MIQIGNNLPIYTHGAQQPEQLVRIVGRRTYVKALSHYQPGWSPMLPANRHLMKAAVAYTTTAKLEDKKMEAYRSAASQKGTCSATSLMVRDFFRPPTIEEISFSQFSGTPGNEIWVSAKDDFKVERVDVSLLGPDGIALASGTATQMPDGRWRFVLEQELPAVPCLCLVAEAFDLPGNCGWFELELERDAQGAYSVKM